MVAKVANVIAKTLLICSFSCATLQFTPLPLLSQYEYDVGYNRTQYQLYFNGNGEPLLHKAPMFRGPRIRPEIKLLEFKAVQEYLSLEYLSSQRKDIEDLIELEEELTRDISKAMFEDKGPERKSNMEQEWTEKIQEFESKYDEVLTKRQHQELTSIFLHAELKRLGFIRLINSFNKLLGIDPKQALSGGIIKEISKIERTFADDIKKNLSETLESIRAGLPFELPKEISDRIFMPASSLIIEVILANELSWEQDSEKIVIFDSTNIADLLSSYQQFYLRDELGNWIQRVEKPAPFSKLIALVSAYPEFAESVFSERQLAELDELHQQLIASVNLEHQKTRTTRNPADLTPEIKEAFYGEVAKLEKSFFERAQSAVLTAEQESEILDFCLTRMTISKSVIGLLYLKHDAQGREVDSQRREKLRRLLKKELSAFTSTLAKRYDQMISDSIDCLPAEHAKTLREKLGDRPEFVKPEVSAILDRLAEEN